MIFVTDIYVYIQHGLHFLDSFYYSIKKHCIILILINHRRRMHLTNLKERKEKIERFQLMENQVSGTKMFLWQCPFLDLCSAPAPPPLLTWCMLATALLPDAADLVATYLSYGGALIIATDNGVQVSVVYCLRNKTTRWMTEVNFQRRTNKAIFI